MGPGKQNLFLSAFMGNGSNQFLAATTELMINETRVKWVGLSTPNTLHLGIYWRYLEIDLHWTSTTSCLGVEHGLEAIGAFVAAGGARHRQKVRDIEHGDREL